MTPAHFPFPGFLKKYSGIFAFYFFAPMGLCFGQDFVCPDSVFVIQQDLTCSGANDGLIRLEVFNSSGADISNDDNYRFTWTPVQPDTVTSQLTNLEAGNYSVTITHVELLCTLSVENILIKAPAPLAINCFVLNDVSSSGTQDGTAKVDCSNGRPPYNIFWTGPVMGDLVADSPGLNSLNNLLAGDYNVTVTDNCGPMQSCIFTIREPLCDNLVDVVTTPPTCNGLANGIITLIPNPVYNERTFEYSWLHDGMSTIQPSRTLPAGQYAVVVSDNTGCRDTITETLTAPLAMAILIDEIIPDTSNKYGEQGQIKGHIVNGFPPFDILWTGSPSGSTYGVNTPDFTILNLKKGSYSINVEDSKGCETQSDVFVGEIFFVEANVEFIIDYSQVLDNSSIPPFMDTLRAKGAELIDTCHCIGGMWLLQHWRNGPEDIIIIDNTPPEGAQASTKSDDNGWYGGITTPKEEDKPIKDPENCKYMPGQGSNKKYRVKVAIIDSGVNLRYHNRPNSGHPALAGLDWTNEEPDDYFNCIAGDINGYDFVNKTANVIDNVGHGTHIAGAIAHAFPKEIDMEFMNLKVYDKEKKGNVFGLTCAIHYAVSNQAQVINLSLGYYSKHPFEPLYNALHRADTSNILVVLSAGNDSIDIDGLFFNQADSLRWPATFKAQNIQTKDGKPLPPLVNLLTVASASEPGDTFLVAEYSNWGKTLVDIATNGLNTSPHLDTTYVTLKGTSMAAANVSREAALICAYDTLITPELIIKAMRNAPVPFSGNTSKGIHATGALDIDDLYLSIPIDVNINLVERELVHPGGSTTVRPRFPGPIVREKYYIKLGDGSIYYDNVEIIIRSSPSLDTVYQATFCSVNSITWFGQDNDDNRLNEGVNYFIKIFINGVAINEQEFQVAIKN